MQSYKLIFFFIIHFFPLLILGQDPYYINYDTKDGLPSSEVYAVEVDSNGIVWFATDRGVCSYNGYEFKTYTTDDGLANNTTLAIWKDRKGDFWFPGLDGSLSIYDHKKFLPYKWNDKLKEHSKGGWIEGLAWNKSDKMYFWLTQSRKLKYSFNDDNRQIEQIDFSRLANKYDHISHDSINFIALEGYFMPNDQSMHNFRMFKLDHYYIYTNQQGIGPFRSVNKISKFSIQDGTYSEYKIKDIINVYLDDSENLWVCAKSGLYQFENTNLDQSPIVYFENIAVSDIVNDKEGNYWITTLKNGVLHVPSFVFKTLRRPTGQLNTEKIMTIHGIKENLIISNSFGDISGFSNKLKLKKIISNSNKQQIDLSYRKKNRLYIGEIIIKEVGGKLIPIKGLNTEVGWKIFELNNGQYFCSRYKGFSVYTQDSKFPIYFAEENPKELIIKSKPFFNNKLISFNENKNKIWIGTTQGLYSISDYHFDQVVNQGDKNPLLRNRINDIKPDYYDNLWLSTIGEGLLYKTKDTLFQFSSKDGLNSDLVNRTFVENDSTLWVATNKGLNKLVYNFYGNKITINNIENYTSSDGLLTNFINDITKWNNKIWLATNKGINYFSSELIDYEIPAPKIILEEILVNDSTYNEEDELILNYDQNDLYFNFTGISYRKLGDQPFYQYRLMSENTDSTWYFTNNRDVRFNDLQAGKYTFEVAAQNKHGQWSERPVVYNFTIQPRFTQTLWFRILSGLAILAIIASFIRTRSNRIKLKEEQKRKLQEAELKTKDAELQALRNQMNPHFVFNALNSIQNFVFKNDAKKANYYLSRFSKLMRDGLQFARLKYISLQEEIIFLNTYLELEKMRFPDKFQYRVIVDDDIPTSQYFIPPLLFQPILENAVKHAFKNIDYEGLLEIRFQEITPGKLLKITITDNGEGINLTSVNKPTKSKNKSLGLEIINNQIALLNSEGKDSKVNFKIFNRNTIDPQLNGTQAEFIISIKFSENDQGGHH